MLGKRIINTATGAAPSACTTDTVQILDGVPLESIATYQLDGNANDLTTNYNGTASNVTYATGKFGQAAVFNGSSSRIQLPSNFNLANNSFSFSFWLANSQTSSSYPSYFICSDTSSTTTNTNLAIGREDSTGKLSFNFFNNGLLSSTSVSTDGTWQHWVCTYDASTNLRKIYLNGSLDNSDTSASDFLGTSNLVLGQYRQLIWALGKIDQVRIFNTALSAGAITNLYNETVATASNTYINLPSLVAYYKMSDATDQTGSYDGTPTNVNFNVAGKFGNAGSFNGSNSKIELANLGIAGSSARTISAWVNVSSLASHQTIFQFGSNASKSRFGIDITTAGKIEVTTFGRDITTSATQITTGNWHHVVVLYNGGSIEGANTDIYIDGSVVSVSNAGTTTSSLSTTNSNYSIGCDTLNSRHFFNGSIDQVRIFNRAITSTEVETLYNEVQCIPTIVPSEHFNTVLYDGDGGTKAITGVGFQPDLTWIKQRSGSASHSLQDTVRGAGQSKNIYSDNTASEGTYGQFGYLSAFNTDGFTVVRGSGSHTNASSSTYASWNWKAGGAAVTNPQGDTASQISANPDAGFSIVTHTSSMISSQTFGHGLSSTPKIVISKVRNIADSWWVFMPDVIGSTNVLELNASAAARSVGLTFNANDTTFNIQWTSSSYDFLHYCFAEVEGFSKFGSYTGTGASGNSIVTGFEPAFLLVKRTDSGDNWLVFDNKRNPSAPVNLALIPNSSSAEQTGNLGNGFSFLSNGFEVVSTDSGVNANGGSYIFMAFAADPTTVEPTLEDSFNTVTYTGNGTTKSITSLDFQPDLVWAKSRTSTNFHYITDSVRGVNKVIYSNASNAEDADPNGLSSFNSNGFTVGTSGGWNGANDYVAWCWKAAEIPAINNNGSISSVVSANPAAGFSIVSYTGTGANGSFGHGLSAAEMVIIKSRDQSTRNWITHFSSLGAGAYMSLNLTSENATSTARINTTTSTVVNIGTSANVNLNGDRLIAYCFHSVDGFSKIGSYVGSSASNSIVTGFEPAFVMIKRTNLAGGRWIMVDNKRGDGGFNVAKILNAQDSLAEFTASTYGINFNSNGFSIPAGASGNINSANNTYVYMAFANQF